MKKEKIRNLKVYFEVVTLCLAAGVFVSGHHLRLKEYSNPVQMTYVGEKEGELYLLEKLYVAGSKSQVEEESTHQHYRSLLDRKIYTTGYDCAFLEDGKCVYSGFPNLEAVSHYLTEEELEERKLDPSEYANICYKVQQERTAKSTR